LYPTQAARKAKRAEEKRRRLETPEIRAAREAREELEKCSAERDEECIYADLARRLDLRERYWTAFETWIRCQRVVEQMKCDKKLRLAVGPDVQIKVDEDIVTAEGYQDLKREVLVLYTMEHSDYLYQRDWCGDAWFASLMIRPPVDEFDDAYEPTWVARQSIKFAKPWTKKRLAKKARELMVDDLREREELRVQEENEEHMQKFEDDCRKRRNEEIGGYGKPRSRWERLWDADEGKPYWHQWETRESVWDKPCVCHVCDSNIPVDDTMCFKCKNKRSEFNQKIYDDNHKKIDYAAFLAAGGVDDESTKQEQQEEVVDVREMDDDDGPPTLYQRYLKKHVVFLKKKMTLTTVQPVIDKVKEKFNDRVDMIYDTYVPAYFKMDKRDYEIRRRRWREWRQKWIKRMGLAARPKRKVMPWHEQDEEDEDGLRRSRPSLAAQRRSFEETGFKGGRGDD